jgi:hypothetical protein
MPTRTPAHGAVRLVDRRLSVKSCFMESQPTNVDARRLRASPKVMSPQRRSEATPYAPLSSPSCARPGTAQCRGRAQGHVHARARLEHRRVGRRAGGRRVGSRRGAQRLRDGRLEGPMPAARTRRAPVLLSPARTRRRAPRGFPREPARGGAAARGPCARHRRADRDVRALSRVTRVARRACDRRRRSRARRRPWQSARRSSR